METGWLLLPILMLGCAPKAPPTAPAPLAEEPLSETQQTPDAPPAKIHTCPPPQYGNRVVQGDAGPGDGASGQPGPGHDEDNPREGHLHTDGDCEPLPRETRQ